MTSITRRFVLVITSVLIFTIIGLSIEVLLSLQTGWQFGHTQQGHLAGWLGFGVLMTVFVYSYKTRRKCKNGWPSGWFFVHQIAGTLAPFIILIHTGLHFHALVPLLTFIAMGIAVTTGLIGMLVHRKAIGLLNETRKALVSQGLSKDDVDNRLFEIASDERMFRIWQIFHIPAALIFTMLLLAHIGGAIYFGGW